MTERLAAIIVVNYNYARFLPSSVSSALAQTYLPLDIVVVDDGSTDNSREVMQRYKADATLVFKENGGMSSAVFAGMGHTDAQVIQILDADDELMPTAISEVMAALEAAHGHRVCKVQYRTELIDAHGDALGIDPPGHVAMPSGDVTDTLLTRGRYVTPVTVGNAYPREILDELMPVPGDLSALRNSVDGYMNTACPFLGNVVSIDAVLGRYRAHGENIWASKGSVSPEEMRARTLHDLAREKVIDRAARAAGRRAPHELMLNDPEHVVYRLASLRADPAQHPIPRDRVLRLLGAGLRAVATDQTLSGADKLLQAATMLSLAILPRVVGRRVFDWMRGGARRPRSIKWLAARLRGDGAR